MSNARASLGRRAEDLACAHLQGQGFEILGRNVRVGHLELDIIAGRAGLVVFCEVRSRRSSRLMTPAQSITPAKVARVRRAAAGWLKTSGHRANQVRFDVASVRFDREQGALNYLEGAF